jgi:7,8-dihydropterin-6-yl-methyl-4-(beta-D-ribofuranosyl)aminobenzene 5'-phosphate synthase
MSHARITIVHDSFGRRSSLRQDWGFAALVEFGGQRILFDTGNDARTFAANCAALDVDLQRLDYAVISHRHGDHTSGLAHLLNVNPRLAIYTPDETYGVFGSSLPGTFYPRRETLPRHMRYFDGAPPAVIRHGTPWPGANFVWTKESAEVSPGVSVIPVVSDVPGTRELREIALGLRTARGLVLIAGCSHPGIESILAASRAVDDGVFCLFGGLHLVFTAAEEVQRLAVALRDEWKLSRIAPGHCTGEPAFEALAEAFGGDYVFAGLGEVIDLPEPA